MNDSQVCSYSVVIPTYNEAQRISATIQQVRFLNSEAEIIVADGESSDGTAQVAALSGAQIVESTRGRGLQCNIAASRASGNILMFLHADTILPRDAFQILDLYFQNPRTQIGTFRLRFDIDHWLLRLYASLTRFDSLFTRYGDQCIVIRRSFFNEIGGFPDWPLFEDVHLLRKARRCTRIFSFPAAVTTSARRFTRLGIFRTQIINARLFCQYLMGVSPNKLMNRYEGAE